MKAFASTLGPRDIARPALLLLLGLCAQGAQAATYSSNGLCVEATYVVPPGITKLHVTAIGGQGGSGTSDLEGNHFGVGGAGGLGTKMVASVNVTPGEPIYVSVADPYVPFAIPSSGFGGAPGYATQAGPANSSGAGGSATYLSANADPSEGGGCVPRPVDVLLVAAGGGGGGGAASFAHGGAGGTETVASGRGVDGGQNTTDDGDGGNGATLLAPGPEGHGGGYASPDCWSGLNGTSGAGMQGGDGGDAGSPTGEEGDGCQGAGTASGAGGGGGAGYWGGGGAGGGSDNSTVQRGAGGGGGAGSSYLKAGATLEQPLSPGCSSLCRNIDPVVVTITPFDTAPAFLTGNAFTLTVGDPVSITLRAMS